MISVEIRENDFDVGEEYTAMVEANAHSGAVVFFVGLVRGAYSNGLGETSTQQKDQIDYIELSHYPGMSEQQCNEIAHQANAHYPFDACTIIHRVGRLNAGEQIVFVAIASRHRDNAFKAGEFIMDYLKNHAPLWKKEVGSRGEHWLGLKESDAKSLSKWQAKHNT